ncbi:WxL domain-containing protein [Candidatus Enterococcus mansonii]|uniref:WxL domain-containing protein n=1 Tax=Candidatus Enterococcus mansonii TaxID=1834181 RepID=A0A242CJD4_9ENTE|nr:WxL domain-containing protein [Enterococcus sp. 4G2_DIV0659]OTO10357.1 hypothetical protein A5880_001041 [Enterococcus sp. 4G2_DIV0659]
MNNTHTRLFALGLTTFAGLMLGATTTFAEEPLENTAPPTIADPQKQQAEISFFQNETDPNKPTDPGTGEEIDGGTGMVGPLTIDYISKIKFENQKLSGNNETYFAKLDTVKYVGKEQTVEKANFVQVTDNRGSNAGWKLQVKQDKQFEHKDEKDGKITKLTGATLSFLNPTMKSASLSTKIPSSIKPVKFDGDADTPVNHDVVTASQNEGMGTWFYTLGGNVEEGKTSISLSVPGDLAKVAGAYSTQLTWTLVDSPA